MGRYVVTAGQNIYDVALHLTGSIEGIVDLLICNPSLSLDTTLRSGDELRYTDGFTVDADTAAYFRRCGATPAGGEHTVYPKCPASPLRGRLWLDSGRIATSLTLAGCGVLQIDWGDNTPLEDVTLDAAPRILAHRFDSTIRERRRISLWGGCSLQELDLSDTGAQQVRLFEPLHTERFTLRNTVADVAFAPLLTELRRCDLTGSTVADLQPLAECRALMTLDMTGLTTSREALDAFLLALVRRHYGRRSCEVTLPMAPSGVYREPPRDEALDYILSGGMEAVWLLTHEPSWNEGGAWTFHIGAETYRYIPIPEPEPVPEPDPGPNPPWHSGGAVN